MPDFAVVLLALAAIAWVNWYFFIASRRGGVSATVQGDVQEAVIVVKGGYQPSTVRIAAGRPTRLVFDRQEDSSCTEEVVIPGFRVRQYLPAHQQTVVELPPAQPGEQPFMCGMSMVHGRLIVE